MARTRELSVAVTIAGSDSGGGAGIQADLKTFAALGVHGLTVVTNVTAQSPKKVRAIAPCNTTIVRSQLEAVYGDFRPAATKIGMLYTADIIRTVSRFLKSAKVRNVVIDPVMISTSGRPLLKSDAIEVLRRQLFPLATLITPNLQEAESLLGRPIRDFDTMKRATRDLHELFGSAILLKGGHLQRTPEAIDVLFDGERETILSAPRIAGIKTHGTGCTYSAAIAGYLAKGCSLEKSVRMAKMYVTKAISRTVRTSHYHVLGWKS